MARKGRELEELVALIEGVLVPQGAVVESPGFIEDRVTGSRREVDVAIRMTVGSAEVLIVVECRDRGVEDVTWIEQLVAKCRDIKAAKVIAVSSTGFSAGARQKAEHEGIELRQVEDLSPAAVSGWIQVPCMTQYLKRVEVRYALLRPDPAWPGDREALGRALRAKPTDLAEKIFVHKETGVACSFNVVWSHVARDERIYEGVPTDGTAVERTLDAHFANPLQRYQVRTDSGLVDIVAIRMNAKLWIEASLVPIDKARAYKGDAGAFAQAVQYKIEINGQSSLLSFVNVDGSIAVALRPEQGEPEPKP